MQYDSRMPGDVNSRILTFSACSGASTKDVMDFQLNQGTPDPNAKYTAIGKPQLATISVGGNNLDFGTLVQKSFICSIKG